MRPYLLLLACLTACTTRDAGLATAVIDTLPGGIVRVTSSGPTAWTDSSGWTLEELPAIQPAQGSPGELIDPSSIAVDAQQRLYVADQKPVGIKVFDSAGALVRSIGREGDGPGEFRSAYIAIRGNRLLVHDPQAHRTSLFDTSGTFIRSFHSVGNYFGPVALDAAWRAVLPLIFVGGPGTEGAPERAAYKVRFDTLGTLLDTISVPELAEDHSWSVEKNGRRFMSVGIPFAPRTVEGFGADSDLLFGASTDFAIVRSSGRRDTAFIMRRAWTPAPLADSVRMARVEQMIQQIKGGEADEVTLRNAFRLSDIPTTQPSFLRLLMDDMGNTWTQGPSLGGHTTFDIFGPDGSYLGATNVPAELTPYDPLTVHGGVVFLATADENGFPAVKRWVIQDGQE